MIFDFQRTLTRSSSCSRRSGGGSFEEDLFFKEAKIEIKLLLKYSLEDGTNSIILSSKHFDAGDGTIRNSQKTTPTN